MSANPIKYVSRTFNTIMADLNADSELSDKPNWFKRILAGIGDMLGMYINAVANNVYLRTAFTRQAVYDLLALIDYHLGNRTTSSGMLTFYIDRLKFFPLTFSADELKGSTSGSIAQSSLQYKSRTGITISLQTTETITVTGSIVNVSGSYNLGDLVRFSSTVSLPSPIQPNRDYYIIPVTTGQIKIALSIDAAIAGSNVILSSSGSGTVTMALWSFQILCYQEVKKTGIFLGSGSGEAFQVLVLPDKDILSDTIIVYVNGIGGWVAVDTFVTGSNSSKIYKILYDSDGTCKIMFADGNYGMFPVGDITVDYSIGGGSNSNVSFYNKIVNYVGGNQNINGVSNLNIITGGGDFESLETAKILAPMSLKTNDRFITVQDGITLSLNYGGIEKVEITKAFYGDMSCRVVIIPSGGGMPSSAIKTDLQAYLIGKTILESVDVRVVDPTYITVDITSAMKIKDGFVWATVEPFFVLACRLFLSEMSTEIQKKYLEYDIASAVTMINAKWATTFTAGDYPQIEKMLSTEFLTPLEFGQSIEESMFISYIQNVVYGCSYLTVSLPASFPVVVVASEIVTDGTITVSFI